MSWKTLITWWEKFWFEPQSPAPICMFRIVYGILLLISTLMYLPEYPNYFGPFAMVSERCVNFYHGDNHFSFLFMFPRHDAVVAGVLYLLLLSAICLIMGFCTRTSCLMAFLCLASLHHRNPLILNGGDSLFRIMAFLLILTPAGKLYSIDSLVRRKGKADAQKKILCAPWATRLIQLQIAALYCQAFWTKAAGDDWISGYAVFYATHLPEYMHLPVPFLLDNLTSIQLLTWGSIAIELALWTLIWVKELRYYVLLAGIALHIGIEWSMNIPLFEFIMMATYIPFIYPEHAERFMEGVKLRLTSKRLTARAIHVESGS